MENQPDLIPAAAGELAQLAEEFCRLIDERDRYSAVEFLRRVHPLLPRLYSAGLAVAPSYDFLFEAPPDEPDEIEEEDDDEPYDIEAGLAERRKDELGIEHWWMLYDSLGALLGKMDAYAEVFDPYVDPPEEPVTGTLSDDLADIYHDLTDGLAKWRRGEHAAAAERWGEYFTIHWGEHVTGALRAIRTLAYPYHWDLSRFDT